MTTEIDVCNRSLQNHLGDDGITSDTGLVADINEFNLAARLCRLNYDQVRDLVTEARIWSFALDRARVYGYSNPIIDVNPLLSDTADDWTLWEQVAGVGAVEDTDYFWKEKLSLNGLPVISLQHDRSNSGSATDDETNYTKQCSISQFVRGAGTVDYEIFFLPQNNGDLADHQKLLIQVGTTQFGNDILEQAFDNYPADIQQSVEFTATDQFYITFRSVATTAGTGSVSVQSLVLTAQESDVFRGQYYPVPRHTLNLWRVGVDTDGGTINGEWRKEGEQALVYTPLFDSDATQFNYIRQSPDLDTWTNSALECLELRLAGAMCTPITENAAMKTALIQEYELRISDAGAIDGSQASREKFRSKSLTGGRGRIGTGGYLGGR